MSNRIPAAIGWLVRRRARLNGLINTIEIDIQRLEKLKSRKADLQQDLSAIDRTLGLYDIPIDAKLIPDVRPSGYQPELLRRVFSHGEITRSLIIELREAEEIGITTSELAIRIFRGVDFEKAGIVMCDQTFLRLKELVRYRLKSMYRSGKVVRLHEQKSWIEGRWKLPDR